MAWWLHDTQLIDYASVLAKLLPPWILLIVVLAVGWQMLASNPEWSYIYDGERGVVRNEVQDYWAFRVPRVVGFGSVIALLVIAAVRAWRTKTWSLLASGIGASALGLGLLALITTPSQSGISEPDTQLRPIPRSPSKVFGWEQWWALQSVTLSEGLPGESKLGNLLESGIGLAEYPGFIPYDRFLLGRVTFIGLNQAELERLVGPPRRIGHSQDYKFLTYVMIGEPPRWLNGLLTFRIRRTVDGDYLVDEELIRGTRRPEY